jgi:hypothetical protein
VADGGWGRFSSPNARSTMSEKRLINLFSADIPPAGSSSRRKERRARAASDGGRGGDDVDLLPLDVELEELDVPDERASSNNILVVIK